MYDVIVLGLGGMGTAAAAALARRGRRVLGLEQFGLAHDRGSSHGHTRVIRTAYFEHPAYVPLVRRAFRLWHELEQRSGKHLLTECPCLSIGRPGGELTDGVLRAAIEHELKLDKLGPTELAYRFPLFRFDESFVGLLEHEAGFLYVERCVEAAAADAQSHGAVLRWNEPVREWRATRAGVEVRTDRDVHRAKQLVITAGPWATTLLGEFGTKFTVMRQTPIWLAPPDPTQFARDRFPIFLADTPEGTYYGLPAIDARGIKIAQHYGAPELATPDEIDRAIHETDEIPMRRFVRQHLPAADGPRTDASVCLYTLSPDRHFVIDRHPGFDNVVIAGGFSGHGFKFAPIIGEVLANLTETGKLNEQLDLFGFGRLLE